MPTHGPAPSESDHGADGPDEVAGSEPADRASASPVGSDEKGSDVLALGLDPDIATPLIMAGSAIAAGLSGLTPTGNAGADFVLSTGIGAFLPWLAHRVDGRSLLYGGLAAVLFSGLQFPAFPLAALAVAMILGPVMVRPADPPTQTVLRTAAAALITHAALHFPNIEWVGTASLLALAALAPILLSAWRHSTAVERAIVWRIGRWVGGFITLATLLAVAAALLARGSVEDGIAGAEDGIDAIQDGDQDRAADLLLIAGNDFRSASDLLGGPLSWPARLVPVVAQHSRALGTAAREGQELAAAAVQTVTTADVDQIRGSNGAIDLELVRDVNAELRRANLVLRNSQAAIRSVRTAWLLPFLDDRLASVEVELLDIFGDIDLADQATAVLPGILGGAGPRQYLVLFVQPAESREYGGFVGAYGLLRADDGRLSLIESGSIGEDYGSGTARFENPGLYPQAYYEKEPARFPQNLTAIADLSTIASAARELSPQWRNDPDFTIDGVMTIDPFALAGFLELTGPIEVDGRIDPIDASNVADYLLRDQYLEFADAGRERRQDALHELASTVFDELLNIEIPGPDRLGAVFGPLARSDRLAFTTFDDDENALFRRILLDADLPVVGEDVQMIGVFGATIVAGKLDAYATRNLTYDVTVDPASGNAVGRLDVELINDAPPDAPLFVLRHLEQDDLTGEPLVAGTNLMVLNLYTRADLGDFAVSDGADLVIGNRTPALSYQHQAIAVEVPIQSVRHASTQLTDTVTPGRYDVLIAAQPTALTGSVSLTVRPTDGWRIVGKAPLNADGSWTVVEDLDVHRPYTVQFERTG